MYEVPCGNNNKDEDNSPKTLNDKNHQALSQKFRQLPTSWYAIEEKTKPIYSFCDKYPHLDCYGHIRYINIRKRKSRLGLWSVKMQRRGKGMKKKKWIYINIYQWMWPFWLLWTQNCIHSNVSTHESKSRSLDNWMSLSTNHSYFESTNAQGNFKIIILYRNSHRNI